MNSFKTNFLPNNTWSISILKKWFNNCYFEFIRYIFMFKYCWVNSLLSWILVRHPVRTRLVKRSATRTSWIDYCRSTATVNVREYYLPQEYSLIPTRMLEPYTSKRKYRTWSYIHKTRLPGITYHYDYRRAYMYNIYYSGIYIYNITLTHTVYL